MKYLLTSIGTRGDIEPFLAIGEILSKQGHEVGYAFSEQYKDIMPEKALFYPISAKIMQLINSTEGRIVMGRANIFEKLKALFFLYKEGKIINQDIAKEHERAILDFNPEVVIHNPKCSYPVIWSLETERINIIVSPVPYVIYPVDDHPHIGINRNLGQFLNKLTYKLSNFGLIKTIYDTQNEIVQRQKFSKKQIRTALFERKLFFSISPQLFKRPAEWPKHVQVLGYHERNKIMNWTPNSEIINFLNAHPKVLFLTFGSMVNSSPEGISEMFYHVILKLGLPCIINTASGGLTALETFKLQPNFLFVDQIPYEWIFPKVHAVIHHGGSGTTQMALKYGLPSLIIPHIIDQYVWNDLIFKYKLGPKGISINNVKPEILTDLILSVYKNNNYKFNAQQMASKMKDKTLESRLVNFISQKVSL